MLYSAPENHIKTRRNDAGGHCLSFGSGTTPVHWNNKFLLLFASIPAPHGSLGVPDKLRLPEVLQYVTGGGL